MSDERQRRFSAAVLPHLDAAYNLARWLVRDGHDAQDVVQEALVRALRHFDGLRGDARPWLLAIVRHAAFAWLAARRPGEVMLEGAVHACERYFPAFQFVVWAGKSAPDAMAAAMFDTAGEA